jgi:hypothetical protein
MGGGETAAEGGRIITMVRRFWGPAPTQKDLGASPLNSLNLTAKITKVGPSCILDGLTRTQEIA